MNRPVAIDRHITLVTQDELPQEVVSDWFKCVDTYSPTGTRWSITIPDGDGVPRSVSLIHREKQDGSHHYIIPLSRELNAAEIEIIVTAFSEEHEDLDFTIRASAVDVETIERSDVVEVDRDDYRNLCLRIAQAEHARWMAEREKAGWRYGPEFSIKEKTHPLMRPWEQLPEKLRIPDEKTPQVVLDFLNDQGYAVITKGELDSLIRLLRS